MIENNEVELLQLGQLICSRNDSLKEWAELNEKSLNTSFDSLSSDDLIMQFESYGVDNTMNVNATFATEFFDSFYNMKINKNNCNN